MKLCNPMSVKFQREDAKCVGPPSEILSGTQATRLAVWLLILGKRFFSCFQSPASLQFLHIKKKKKVSECGQASLSPPFQSSEFCIQFRGTGIPSAVLKGTVQPMFTGMIVNYNTMGALTRTKWHTWAEPPFSTGKAQPVAKHPSLQAPSPNKFVTSFCSALPSAAASDRSPGTALQTLPQAQAISSCMVSGITKESRVLLARQWTDFWPGSELGCPCQFPG